MSVFVDQNTAGSQSVELFAETLNRMHEAPPAQKIGDNEVSLHRQPCETIGWGGGRTPTLVLCSRNARPQKDGKGSLVVLLLAERAR